VVDNAAGEFTPVLFEDVASDPTLPRTKPVLFQVTIMSVLFSSVGSDSEPGLTATTLVSLAQATAREEDALLRPLPPQLRPAMGRLTLEIRFSLVSGSFGPPSSD
jgi:DNA-directed RNA polymerase II subunit RPB9